MNDIEALESIVTGAPVGSLGHKREANFVNQLKIIWRERELDHISQHGRSPFCDCLMFRSGDFLEAKRRVDLLDQT